jgi:putative acetyltransferase
VTVSSYRIRAEIPSDRDAVFDVHRTAFGGPAEATLVARLHADGDALCDLVALECDRIIGHILFSALRIETEEEIIAAAALAPLAVLPERQRCGIGTALVRAGLAACRALRIPAVVVLRDPRFYDRSGFAAEVAARLRAPWSGPHLMAIEVIPGALGDRAGALHYAAAFACLR